MIPKEITKEHVIQAIAEIDTKGLRYPLAKSSTYDLVYNGNNYPPKHTLAIAAEFATGTYLEYNSFNSTESRKFLENLGEEFKIVLKNNDPLAAIIEKYKEGITVTKLKDELYKWELINKYKGLPDLSSAEFFTQLKSIDYSNLIFGVTNSVISHISEAAPERYFKCFELLFDNEKPIQSRIRQFHDTVFSIYRDIGVENLSHHHDERTMSTFLTFKYPDRYPLFKYTFYEKFCYYLKAKPAKRLFYYADYIDKLEKFIHDYIKPDEELKDLVKGFMPDSAYADPNYLLLAQDILYQVLDKGLGEERKYWRIGTKDADTSYWNDMKNNGFVSIGWADLGNLDEQEVSDENAAKILMKKSYYKNKNEASTLGKKAKEVSNFYNKINVGDVVLAQDGQRILGIGIVESTYTYDETRAFPHLRKVVWYNGEPKFKNTQGLRTTVSLLSSPLLIDQVDEYANSNDKFKLIEHTDSTMKLDTSLSPLNQILYGPPGTGKTYHTINKALSIIENKSENDLGQETRDELKERYQAYVTNGQIVFATFHQSMSYEDFVEGIKPEIEEDKDGVRSIVYITKDGIFKELCNNARVISVEEEDGKEHHFDDAWNALLAEVQNHHESETDFVLGILTPKMGLKVTEVTNNGNLRLQPKGGSVLDYLVSYARLKELQKAIPNLSKVKNIDKEFRTVIGGMNATAYWAVLNYVNNWLTKANTKISPITSSKKSMPHVLIIDEINRGNVSAIFGELITLIEESKRQGKPEALEVVLPYSKQKFSVPANLYIIGTMNTADRSVEALDTALRRRFSFVEMLPQPDHESIGTVDGLPLGSLLEKINNRLEKLLSRDHTIGHSFFINVETPKELYDAFYNKIIPLLQEYFFGDYGKIGLVLGNAFVKLTTNEKTEDSFFATFEYEEKDMLFEKKVYRIQKFANDYLGFLEAVKAI